MSFPQIIIEGAFNEDFVRSALLEIYLRNEMPGSIEYFFFIDEPKQFEKIEKFLPEEAREKITGIYYKDPTSLSITYKYFDIIIVSISKEESYLKQNRNAMIGLILHEIMHLKQRRRGLDTKIERDGKKEIHRIAPKVFKLKYSHEEIEDFFLDVYDAAVHTMKEIYDNIELIDRGLGDFVLEDHKNLYKKKKVPFFYESIKKAKKNKQTGAVHSAFLYELNLMAAVIPFTKMARAGSNNAKKFVLDLQDNFEAPIYEISEEFTDIIEAVLREFSWSSRFRRRFFRQIFELCYTFLK